MKIRAELPNESFFIEVTQKELANMLGEEYYSSSSNKMSALRSTIHKAIGADINIPISTLYQKRDQFNSIVKYKKLNDILNQLQVVIHTLKPLQSTFDVVNEEFEAMLMREIENKK